MQCGEQNGEGRGFMGAYTCYISNEACCPGTNMSLSTRTYHSTPLPLYRTFGTVCKWSSSFVQGDWCHVRDRSLSSPLVTFRKSSLHRVTRFNFWLLLLVFLYTFLVNCLWLTFFVRLLKCIFFWNVYGDIWIPAPGTAIQFYLRSFVYILKNVRLVTSKWLWQTVLQINEAVM